MKGEIKIMQYISCFIVSLIFMHIAVNKYSKEKKKSFYLYSLIALLIPSILAGARATTVGTDTMVYTIPVFDFISEYGHNIIERVHSMGVEYGYIFFTYIIVLFTKNHHVLLFAIQMTIITLIYSTAIYHYKTKKVSPVMYMMVYFFTFYNVTLNLSRQAIAIAIIIFASRFLENKKYAIFAVFTMIATLFHTTAIFALTLIVINILLERKDKAIYKVFLVFALLVIVVFSKNFIELGINYGLLPAKYNNYLTKYLKSSMSLDITNTIFKVGIIAIFLWGRKRLVTERKENDLYGFLLIIDVILMQIGIYMSYADRIAFYFGYMSFFVILPQFMKLIKDDKTNRRIGFLAYNLVLITYWYLVFVHNGVGETYPYLLG